MMRTRGRQLSNFPARLLQENLASSASFQQFAAVSRASATAITPCAHWLERHAHMRLAIGFASLYRQAAEPEILGCRIAYGPFASPLGQIHQADLFRLFLDLVDLGADPIDPPTAAEVEITPSGQWAFVRYQGLNTIQAVQLQTGQLGELDGGINPTDLSADTTTAIDLPQDLVDRILGRETDFMI